MANILLVDSSGLLAALDAGEPDHRRITELLQSDRRPLILTDFVIAEVDYLILRRLGIKAEQDFIDQLLAGIFLREPITDKDLVRARTISAQYGEHQLGLTDSTLMALCERFNTSDILTLDHRHFGIFRKAQGQALKLLP